MGYLNGMIRISGFIGVSCLLLSSAASQTYPPNTPRGQYVRPAYQNPTPTAPLQPDDVCRSQLYQGLVGRSEGAIYMPGLPASARILKPAFTDEENPLPGEYPPSVEVRDYLPGQPLYAPTNPLGRGTPDDYRIDRLTIQLDQDGIVQTVSCG